jgi:hypothetical protein
MPDSTEDSTSTDNQVTDATTETADGGTTTSTTETEEFDKDRALALIAKLRTELKDERKTAKAAKSELDGIKTAGLSETERLQQELDTIRNERDKLVQETRKSQTFSAAREAAKAANADDPDAVAELIAARVSYDEDGSPVGVDAAVKDIRAKHPKLFANRTGTADAGKGRSGDAPDSDWIRSIIGR